MAQAPAPPGSGPAPAPNSPNNASGHSSRPGQLLTNPFATPPVDHQVTRLTNALAGLSVGKRGRMGTWRWRCEYCGQLNDLSPRAIEEEQTRIWHLPDRINPHASCDLCRQTASWNHIASEIQVNRALREPHQYLYPHHADHFRELIIRDPGHNLRVLAPADVASLHAEALRWLELPYGLIHRGNPGPFGRQFRTPHSTEKICQRQIRAATNSLYAGKLWNRRRILI